MDRLWLFLFLYGTVALIGVGLTSFWGSFAINRWRALVHPAARDRAFVLSVSIALVAMGLTIYCTARVIGNATYGLSMILRHNSDAWPLGIALGVIICGLLKMVWLADLEDHPPRWIWLRTMIGITMLWGVIAFILLPSVPLGR